MPCRYDPTPQEEAAARKREEERITAPLQASKRQLESQVGDLENKNAALSARVDELTETILQMHDGVGNDYPPHEFFDELRERQEKHRKADLDRLLTCGKITDADLIRKVAMADPTRPLQPQLGFDPDLY